MSLLMFDVPAIIDIAKSVLLRQVLKELQIKYIFSIFSSTEVKFGISLCENLMFIVTIRSWEFSIN